MVPDYSAQAGEGSVELTNKSILPQEEILARALVDGIIDNPHGYGGSADSIPTPLLYAKTI